MSNLCIIPARGGSKRIPGKNIKDFLGKPIIAYSIDTALRSGLFDEVMVSTDDDEIAAVAKLYGAKIPFKRSADRANDFATTAEVLEEVLENYQKHSRTQFEYVCCLYPCAPFVTESALRSSFDLLAEQKLDSVFPIVQYGFPIQRALRLESNKISFIHPQYALSRSQDLESSYHDAGQFYWINGAAFLKKKQIVSENSGAVVVSEMESQDIDNEIDWQIAELKYTLLNV